MYNPSYVLDDHYSIMYTSAHQANLIYDEEGEHLSGKKITQAKIVRVNLDENYIIMEREKLDSDGKPNGELDYFIEDKNQRALVGASLSQSEFNELLAELNIELELLKVTEFEEID
ncbi:hypothetical protein [Alkalihalobacillus trypoxylicola]|uniref:Uncharacterized protein n=1 Tax=Alkalihalobacillus trypoxylicola TaxID=519424 RepID=A0A162E5E7_9BACI|nr:hypothetical protein [Alkalihalobacillus trypoxylicola]KYG31775.1 hypothetical protein AZF04_03050 [Alkalihalobacillus trypoxylicola]